jgi:hypothetical protein
MEAKMFSVVGAVVTSRVWSQLQNRVTTEKSAEAVQFEVVPNKKCYKIVKWIIVARPRNGQINKALNKNSTSYLSRY